MELMKLVFSGTRQELFSFLRILCLIEGDKPLMQFLQELKGNK